ncbi:MAG TPA: anti-sigma factor [Solirubrobacteraceae bacterium]
MSSGLEHRDCAEALGAYILGSLPDAESERVQRHLSGCRECRAEFDSLRLAADALPASVTPVSPPPELKSRVMAIVQAEAELLQAAGEAADRPPRRRRSWSWLTTELWRPAVALGSTAAVAAVAVVLATSGSSTRTIQAQYPGPGSASLTIQGTQAQLVVKGLRPPPANHVDELWVKRGAGRPQPAGTFVLSSGSVRVGQPVRPGDVVMVTVEPGQGTPAPTSTPFLVVHA